MRMPEMYLDAHTRCASCLVRDDAHVRRIVTPCCGTEMVTGAPRNVRIRCLGCGALVRAPAGGLPAETGPGPVEEVAAVRIEPAPEPEPEPEPIVHDQESFRRFGRRGGLGYYGRVRGGR
jgi:ribosomal protein S27E